MCGGTINAAGKKTSSCEKLLPDRSLRKTSINTYIYFSENLNDYRRHTWKSAPSMSVSRAKAAHFSDGALMIVAGGSDDA